MGRPKLDRERINITLPRDLLRRLDAHAEANGATRSDALEEAAQLLLRQSTSRPTPKISPK